MNGRVSSHLANASKLGAMPSSGILQRKCGCGQHTTGQGECAECKKKTNGASGGGLVQRLATSVGAGTDTVSVAPPIVHEALRSSGQPLDTEEQRLFQRRFQHDFSKVRVHTNSAAVRSSEEIGAAAYATGNHVVLGESARQLGGRYRRAVLSHELAHVVQQSVDSLRDPVLTLSSGGTHEKEATAAAAIQHGSSRIPFLSKAPAQVMLLTPEEFRKQLGQTREEEKAINALFANRSFLGLWNYTKACPTVPHRDLGPLALDVQPGLVMSGKERFGGYFPGATPTLKINPTKSEHQANPAELVDTIVHELIHAVSDLESGCKQAGAGPAPLDGAGTAVPPSRASVQGTSEEERLLKEQGPGASNPCEEFLDINSAAQHLVVQIIKADIQASGVGRPTVTFVNEIIRNNPRAMTDYKACRDVACNKPDPAQRDAGISACASQTLNRYYVPPPDSSVKPPAPARPKFGPLYKPRRDFNDKIQQSVENL